MFENAKRQMIGNLKNWRIFSCYHVFVSQNFGICNQKNKKASLTYLKVSFEHFLKRNSPTKISCSGSS